jgi:hypothetical protein
MTSTFGVRVQIAHAVRLAEAALAVGGSTFGGWG